MTTKTARLQRAARVLTVQKTATQGRIGEISAQAMRLSDVKRSILEGAGRVFGHICSGPDQDQARSLLERGEAKVRVDHERLLQSLKTTEQKLRGVARALGHAEAEAARTMLRAEQENISQSALLVQRRE
jgi:hypothetical protein